MQIILGLVSILLYLAATFIVGRHLFAATRVASDTHTALAATAAPALLVHGVLLYQLVATTTGLDLGVLAVASLIAWAIVALLLLALLVRPIEDLGIFVLPLAAITVALSLTGWGGTPPPVAYEPGMQIHIAASVLAYGLLSIAAFQSLVLAYQEWRLRHKRPGGVLRVLPPLQSQENLLFQLVGLGFVLLSLSLITGFMFVHDMLAQHLVHKTVLSVIAWLVFAVLLWGRWRYGWRGRTAIRWSLAGFVILALAYFGSKFVLEVVLGYNWTPG